MPVLPYCMLLRTAGLKLPRKGVGGRPVRRMTEADLLCLYSEGLPPASAEAALEFHRVLAAVMKQASPAPFRFPTVLELEELRRFLHLNSAHFARQLERVQQAVQMELRITATGEPQQAAASGRQYLAARARARKRLQSGARRVRRALGPLARRWRERETAAGLRCYVLVDREQVPRFRERVPAGGGLSIQVSGPWPPTEFLEAL